MIHTSFTIRNKNTGDSSIVSGDFEDNEIELLKDYKANVQRLLETRSIKESMFGGYKIQYDDNSGLVFESSLPDEDYISAFLHRMRFFILNKERSSYNSISGIIKRRLNNSMLNQKFQIQRLAYDGKTIQSMIQIQCDEEIINSEKMLLEWLNSYEYHNDEDKKENIIKLHNIFPLEVSRVIFIMMLREKAKSIISINSIIDSILDGLKSSNKDS